MSDEAKSFSGELVTTPNYGENPWQETSGLFLDPENPDPLAIGRFTLEQGAPPSFNNFADVDRLLQTMTHIEAGLDKNNHHGFNIALGAKHGNMCGASVGDSYLTPIEQMLDGDKVAIFGGSIMLNHPLDPSAVSTLLHYGVDEGRNRLLDVVTASSVNEGLLESLERKGGKLRILTNPELDNLSAESLDRSERFRYVRGGFLAQSNYDFVPDFYSEEWQKENDKPSPEIERSLILAWAIGSTSTSNTITIVRNDMLIGNGVGQQDRVSAAELAVSKAKRAGHYTEGAVAYSDSFFPFPDGPQVLARAGIKAVFTSSGSVKDNEVFATFERNDVQVFSIPDKKGRGFYGH